MPTIEFRHIEICVFKRINGSPLYLLMRRSAQRKMYPGIWQIITGKIDANEKAIDAALRELGEETGISPVGFWVVPHVTTFYSHQSDTVNHIPFFAAEAAAETDPRLSPEHDAFEWVNFGETQRRIVWPGQQEGVRIVHQYIVGDEPAAKLTKIL